MERDHLDHIYPLPAGYHAVRMNDSGEMAVLTGQGTAHAAATIMALGLDPRFDLSHAYWIVAGIAGGMPRPRLARLGGVGAMGGGWRPGLRDRCARDSARLDHGLSAAAQDASFREACRTAAGQVYALNPAPRRVGFQPDTRYAARRFRPAERDSQPNSMARRRSDLRL